MSNTWMTTGDGKAPQAGSTVTVHTPNGQTQGTFAGQGAGVTTGNGNIYWPTTKG